MKIRLFFLTLVTFFLFSITGCASISGFFFSSDPDTVTISYECPPDYAIPVDSRVSVFRFESDLTDRSAAGHLGNYLGDGFFQMLFGDPSGIFGNERNGIAKSITKEIKKELKSNPDIVLVPAKKGVVADYYFYGGLTDYYSSTSTTICFGDKKGKEYKKSVDANVTYQLIEAESKKVVYSYSRKLSHTASPVDSKFAIPSADEVLEYDISSFAKNAANAIKIHKEEKYFHLQTIKEKNPDFKAALKSARKNKYSKAYEEFNTLYSEQEIPEAGYNAILMLLADGRYSEAEAFCGKITASNKDKIFTQLEDSVIEISDSQLMVDQMMKRLRK